MKQIFLILVSSTAFIAGSMIGSSQTQSLPIGGDFEQQQDWYPTILPETRQYTAFDWDSHIFHSGSHSLSIAIALSHPANQEIAYNWTRAVPGFQEGKSYELSGWVRTEKVKGTAWIVVQCWNDARNEMLGFATTQRDYPVSGTSDWTKVRTAFTVPEGTAAVRICAGIAVPENIGGKVWFDDIDIRESR